MTDATGMAAGRGGAHGHPRAPLTLLSLALLAVAVVAAMAAVAALSMVVAADGPGAGDAGASVEHAMALPEGTWDGELIRNSTLNDTKDFYSFEFEGGRFIEMIVTIHPQTTSFDTVVYHVYDRLGLEVVNFTFSGTERPVRFASLTNQAFPTIQYYLSLTWAGDKVAPFHVLYNVSLVKGPKQNDLDTGGDVGNDTAHAAALPLGSTATGSIGGSLPLWHRDLDVDGADAYEVTPVAKRFVVLRAKLDSTHPDRKLGFDLRVIDQTGRILAQEPVLALGQSAEIRQYSDTSLPIFALIVSESESCNYTLTVEDAAPPVIDLYVASINVTPPKPIAGRPATITVTFRSTTAAIPVPDVTCQVYAGTDKLWEGEVIFDSTGTAVSDVTWTAIYGATTISARVDTLNDIPYETSEGNNQLSISVTAHDPGEDGGGGGKEPGNGSDWVWLAAVIVIILVAIAVAVAYAALRVRGRPPEGEGQEP